MEDLYFLKKEDLFKKLDSNENGLSTAEATKRQKFFGKNIIKEKDSKEIFEIFLSQFKSPFVYVLIFSTILAFFLGEKIDAMIILGIIIISSGLSFYQEFKSNKILKSLKRYLSFKTKVLRDGEKTEIDVKNLVPGDIVFLNIGDIVPADLRILDSEELYVNESVITGESVPVNKNSDEIKILKKDSTKLSNILFMGSEISAGNCRAIVIFTGEKTQFGKTVEVLSSKEPSTNFQKGISKFGNFLIKLVVTLTIFVFLTNIFSTNDFIDSLLFAIALAVGVTPELLPVIITVSLSKGAMRMAEKKVIVKKLISIEDIGNMDVLCIDKTGTITESKLTLEDYFDINGKKNKKILEYAAICNSAISNKYKVVGNIIDKNIIEYIRSKGIKIPDYKRIEDIEFSHKRKRMSSIVEIDRKRFLICKGEPLSVIESCSKILLDNKFFSKNVYYKKIKEKYEKLSSRGLRVISIAYKEIETKEDYTEMDEKNLIFLGFLIFSDPPKKNIKKILNKLNSLGVNIKIVTGDNELVTKEICRKIGFNINGKIIHGKDLEEMDNKKFLEVIDNSNVFVEVVPEQKLKIVEGLIKKGHITGFLGDGVNDAPALKIADIGITVDNAIDIARNSADIILLKKDLEVIFDGILEGRKTFGNTTKYILNTTSANFGNMFTLSISTLYFNFIPLLPKQVLLLNLISDVPLVTISSDNIDESYLKKPKKWDIKKIRNFMLFFGVISFIFDIITITLFWFFIAPKNIEVFRTAWFTESVLSEILITFSIRTKEWFWKSKPSNILILSSIFGIFLTFFLIYSNFGFLLGLEYMKFSVLFFISLILITYFLITEIGKKIFYNLIDKEF